MSSKIAPDVRVISQQPPGGRCRLYAGYADVLADFLRLNTELVFTEVREAHGHGSPSLLLGAEPVQPADGVILMPADICAALEALGHPPDDLLGLAEALEAPLERMLEGE